MALSYILTELQHFRPSAMLIFLPFRIKRQNKSISLLKRLLKTLEEHLNQYAPKFYPAHSECALGAALQAATILVAMASEKKMATELSAKVAIWRSKDISSKE